MSALTSLLVRDQRVPVRKIEEAIQRQVISGGRLDTVLLELKLVPENVMAAYLAVIHGLLPATREEVMKVPRAVVRMVPREVAAQHRLVPLSCEDRTLCVAISDPLEPHVESQLGFLLGVELVQRVVPTVRIASGLHSHYGVDMVPRMRRLADKLQKADAGSIPFVAPLEQNVAEGRPDEEDEYGHDDEEESSGGVSTKKFGIVAAPPDEHDQTVRVRQSQVVGVRRSTRPPPPVGSVGSVPPTATKLRVEPPAPKRVAIPSSELVRSHRGPMTARRGVELLGEAKTRDEILEVIFAFGKQFFDYMVLFVVQDGAAEGLDATGEGAVYEDVQRVAVDLSEPGAVALCVEGAVPLVTHLDQTDTERELKTQLLREAAMPAVVIPIAIRQRVVLLLYGDRSGDDFGLADVPELLGFAPRVSEAFQQLILRKKFKGYEKGEEQEEQEEPVVEPADSRTQTLRPPPVATGEAPPAIDLPRVEPVRVDELDAPDTSPGSIPVAPIPAEALIQAEESIAAEPSGIARAVQSSLPPPPDPEPQPFPKKKPRTRAMDVLGVPRSAPPPPKPGSQPAMVAAGGAAAVLDETRLHPLEGPTSSRTTEVDVPVPGAVPVPDDDDDDEPEIEIDGDIDVDVDEELLAELEQAGHYSMSGPVDQVGAPATGRRRRKRDPRSAGPARKAKVDVVRLDGVTPTASPRTRSGRPDSEPPKPLRRSVPDGRSSVIVDMGDDIERLVEELKTVGPEDDSHSVPQMVSIGEASLPVLVREFPGPLWFDRHRPHRRLPRGRDISAIARAMVAFGDRAVPYIVSLLDQDDSDVRFYATLLASEYTHRDLVAPLGRRIFDSDKGTATLALDVLRMSGHFRTEIERVLEMIRATARVPRRPAEQRAHAAFALGELRDPRSLDLLIELLGVGDDPISDAAHAALLVLTRQDFGRSRRKWEDWAESNGMRHRVEWLIDGLLHSDEAMRSAAGDELKHLTQEYYGYHPSLPRRDREIAQRKYRRWWEAEGQRRFGA